MIKRTLYFGNPAYLSLRQGQLIVARPGEGEGSERSIPVEDVGFVVLDHRQITVTQGLLAVLAQHKCAVLNCGANHLPSALMLPMSGNTLYGERIRSQVAAPKPLSKQLWQQTVRAKIANQAAVLAYSTGEEHANMLEWVRAVRSGDSTNLEARAASYYWKSLFRDDFTRGRFDGGENILLNYGYALLRAVMARALVCSGLSVSIGINHHSRYNSFSLADDVMEPYRPCVDRMVVDLVRRYGPVEALDTEIKKELLGIPVTEVSIDGKRSPLMIAASVTAASLVKCFARESERILYPVLQ